MENHDSFISELGLSLDQTEILYNFEKLKTEADISIESDLKKKELKIEWSKQWSQSIGKIFSENLNNEGRKIRWYSESELRDVNKKEFTNTPNKIWYYLVILEANFFEPYFPLEVYEEIDKKGKKTIIADKKFARLKINKKPDWLTEFVKVEGLIELNFIERIRKTYESTYSRLTGKWNRLIVYGLGIIVVTALSFGTAALFAPQIAVLLVGSSFAGLKGIALINACLAYIGGGAIAAGGGGMAAGVATIAGGGAVLGFATGAAAVGGVHALGLFSNPELALSQIARLEVTMKEIVLNSQRDVRFAQVILKKMNDSVKTVRDQLDRLEMDAKNNKEEIAKLRKVIDILKNAHKSMEQFSNVFA